MAIVTAMTTMMVVMDVSIMRAVECKAVNRRDIGRVWLVNRVLAKPAASEDYKLKAPRCQKRQPPSLQSEALARRQGRRTGALQDLADLPTTPVIAKQSLTAVVLYRFFPSCALRDFALDYMAGSMDWIGGMGGCPTILSHPGEIGLFWSRQVSVVTVGCPIDLE